MICVKKIIPCWLVHKDEEPLNIQIPNGSFIGEVIYHFTATFAAFPPAFTT